MAATGPSSNADRAWQRGVIAGQAGDYATAASCLAEAVHAGRKDPLTWYNLALAHHRLGDLRRAEHYCRRALRAGSGASTPLYSHQHATTLLAQTLSQRHRTREAIDLLQGLCARHPENYTARHTLAFSCQQAGHIDESIDILQAILADRPADTRAIYYLSCFQPHTPESPLCAQTRQALAVADHDAALAFGHFALAMMLERGGRHAEAFAAYQRANHHAARDLGRQHHRFDRHRHRQGIDWLIGQFDHRFIHDRLDYGRSPDRDLPVLILGTSRSGKSLLASLLDGHRSLRYLGERGDLTLHARRHETALRGTPGPDGRDAAARLGRDYAKALRAAAGPAARGIDSNPLNLMYLGLLAVAIPEIPVILVERDERDLAIANYFKYYNEPSQAYSYDLRDCLGYLRDYRRLMQHWREIAPCPIHTVHYEELVADPDRVIAGVLGFLGLEPEAGCGANRPDDRHHEALTPGSSLATRTRIEDSQTGIWRRFAEWLPPDLFRE